MESPYTSWESVKDQLFTKLVQRQLVLFLGAGISLWKPSSLPSGMELVKGVIGGLCDEIDITPYEYQFNEIYRYAPEIIFQAIYESLSERTILLNIYKAFEGIPPNYCHRVLGAAAFHGWQTLITTNQDCLIEESSTRPVEVVYTDADFVLKKDLPQLFKLHGTSGGADTKEKQKRKQSIQLTLYQMGAGLSSKKANLLGDTFKNHDFLFVGYSGGDYDICQFLDQQLQKSKSCIYWNIRPGLNVRTQHRHVWQLQVRYPNEVIVFERDLRELFQDIATAWNVRVEQELLNAAYIDNFDERKTRNKHFVLPWARDLSRFQKLLTLGWVLFSTNMPSTAYDFAGMAVKESNSTLERGLGLLLKGYACRERSMHREAIRYLREAYDSFECEGDKYRMAQALHKIGEASSTREMVTISQFITHPYFHRGIRNIQRALDLYRSRGEDESSKGMQRATEGWAVMNEAQIYQRIGWHWEHFVPVVGRRIAKALYTKAKGQLVEARNLLDKSGDLRGVAQAIIALADIEPDAGYAEEGGGLSDAWTIDLIHQGNSLYRQAMKSARKGDSESARRELEAALQCHMQVGAQAEVSAMAALLANQYMNVGDIQNTSTYVGISLEAKGKTNGSYIWNLIGDMFLLRIRARLWWQSMKSNRRR